MTQDAEEQIKLEFISEAAEMLAAVEGAFIEFEKTPNDQQIIDKIFRLAHTIKGSALSCGFVELGEFAHVVETLLVRVRERKVAMSPAVVDLLLDANDRLTAFVAALKIDMVGSVETQDVKDRINSFLQTQAEAPAKPILAPAEAAPAWGLFDDEPTTPSVPEVPCPPLAVQGALRSYLALVRWSLGRARTAELQAALDASDAALVALLAHQSSTKKVV